MDKCCGNCKWHEHDEQYGDWVCVNADSENVADFTDYEYSCEEFKEKEN